MKVIGQELHLPEPKLKLSTRCPFSIPTAKKSDPCLLWAVNKEYSPLSLTFNHED